MMTNLQLMLSIGIPSLLILVAWMQQNARLARSESQTDKGFERMDRRFEAVQKRFEAVHAEMIALRDSIHRDMVPLHERLAVVEAKQA